MAAITTYRTQKPFAWSYSKLKNFETCPKRHYEIDVAKNIKEEDSDELKWGNTIHKSAAKHLGEGAPLIQGTEVLQPWCDRIKAGGGTILVEQKLAITRDFGKCDWFDRNAWYRGIGDVIKIVGDVALVVDWKTGKILEDSVQLALMAQCVFAHHPEVTHVRSEFVWLKEDASSREDFSRDDMAGLWRLLWPRLELLEHAHNTTTYPAKPGRLCRKWCPVQSCPHWGKS